MKMIKYPIIALALLAFSCQKSDQEAMSSKEDTVIFSAGGDLSTRAAATLKNAWTVGDKLGITSLDEQENVLYNVTALNGSNAILESDGPNGITYPNSGDPIYCFGFMPYDSEFGESQVIDLNEYQEDLIISKFVRTSKKAGEDQATPVELEFSHLFNFYEFTLDFKDEFFSDGVFTSIDEINVNVYAEGVGRGNLTMFTSNGTEITQENAEQITDFDGCYFKAVLSAEESEKKDLKLNFEKSGDIFKTSSFLFPSSTAPTVRFEFIKKDDQGVEVAKKISYAELAITIENQGIKCKLEFSIDRDEVTYTSNPVQGDDNNIDDWEDETVENR